MEHFILFIDSLTYRIDEVDKKEINQMYSSFVKECPNGRMSRDDLLRIYRQFFPFGNAVPFVDRLIKILSSSMDTVDNNRHNVSGIEFTEYVTGLSVISRGRLDEKLYCKLSLYCISDCDCIYACVLFVLVLVFRVI